MLKEENDFVSGAKISSKFGITRAAVWKKIETLRKRGFSIAAVPSKGYKLIESPDLSEEEIMMYVKGDFWKRIHLYKSLDSTNDIATSFAMKNMTDSGIVIIADSQNRGRGRLGRKWSSPPGVNIYMSIILKPEIEPRDATLITVLAAVACAGALRKICGLEVMLKWPNDMMVADKKIAGILTEVRSEPDRIKTAIIGVGINVNIELKDFPEDIRCTATSVRQETGEYYSRSRIIIEILKEFENWYKIFIEKGRRPILEKWKQLSSTIGRNVRVTTAKEIISGIAEDIDDEGMLIIKLRSGRLRKISAGDITVLR
ncbi:MAG: biotin--[acetyl-CoA-carboxylase] ligase [Nitrospirota bacterium]